MAFTSVSAWTFPDCHITPASSPPRPPSPPLPPSYHILSHALQLGFLICQYLVQFVWQQTTQTNQLLNVIKCQHEFYVMLYASLSLAHTPFHQAPKFHSKLLVCFRWAVCMALPSCVCVCVHILATSFSISLNQRTCIICTFCAFCWCCYYYGGGQPFVDAIFTREEKKNSSSSDSNIY